MDIRVLHSSQLADPSLRAYFTLRAQQYAAFYGTTSYSASPQKEDERPGTSFYLALRDFTLVAGVRVCVHEPGTSDRLAFERHDGCKFEDLLPTHNKDATRYCEIGGLVADPMLGSTQAGRGLLRHVFNDLMIRRPPIQLAFASVRFGSAALGLRLLKSLGLNGLIKDVARDADEPKNIKRVLAIVSFDPEIPLCSGQIHGMQLASCLNINDAKALRPEP